MFPSRGNLVKYISHTDQTFPSRIPVPFKNQHSHRTSHRLLPPHQPKPRPDPLDQLHPILHLSLPTIETLRHQQVPRPQPRFHQASRPLPRRRQQRIHHHDERTFFHRGGDMPEDLPRLGHRPVMEDPAEEEDVGGGVGRLWGEEVVRLEADAGGDGVWELGR